MTTHDVSSEWQVYPIHGSTLTVKASSGDVSIVGDSGDRVLVDQSHGPVRVKQIEGGLQVKAGSGQIRLRVPKGLDITVKALSGDVDLRDTQGSLNCKALSGDVDCAGITGSAAIVAMSGTVKLTQSQLNMLRVEAYSGDIRAETILAAAGKARLETKSGDILLRVPPSQGLDVQARLLSGDLTCELPYGDTRQDEEGHYVGQRVCLRTNDGGAEVSMDTLSGDIRIEASEGEMPMPAASPRPTDKLSESPWDAPTEARQPFAIDDAFEPDLADYTEDDQDGERMAILEAIEKGEMDVGEAVERLRQLD